MKWVSWESFYISYTLDKTHLVTKHVILMTELQTLTETYVVILLAYNAVVAAVGQVDSEIYAVVLNKRFLTCVVLTQLRHPVV